MNFRKTVNRSRKLCQRGVVDQGNCQRRNIADLVVVKTKKDFYTSEQQTDEEFYTKKTKSLTKAWSAWC